MKYGTRYTDKYHSSGTRWTYLKRSDYSREEIRAFLQMSIFPAHTMWHDYSAPRIRRVGNRILLKQTFQSD